MENTMILSEIKVKEDPKFEIWKKFGNKKGKLQFLYECNTLEELHQKIDSIPMTPKDVLHIIKREIISYLSLGK